MSDPNNSSDRFQAPLILLTWMLYAAVAAIPLLILWSLRKVLAPFAIALLLALLINPAITRLERIRIPRRLSIAIISLVFLGIFAIVAVYLIPMLAKQLMGLPELARRLPSVLSAYSESWRDFTERMRVPDSVMQAFEQATDRALEALPGTLTSIGASLARSAGYILWLVIIPIVTVYLLGDLERIGKKAVYILPSKHQARISSVASEIGQVFLGWARGMAIVSILNGTMIGLSMSILGVPYFLLLGIAGVLLYPVPYLGPLLTAGICFITALATTGIAKATIAVFVVLFFNFFFDNLVTPKIVGSKVGLHPVFSLMALLIGANIFGVLGMLFALPVAATIQILLVQAIPRLGDSSKRDSK